MSSTPGSFIFSLYTRFWTTGLAALQTLEAIVHAQGYRGGMDIVRYLEGIGGMLYVYMYYLTFGGMERYGTVWNGIGGYWRM